MNSAIRLVLIILLVLLIIGMLPMWPYTTTWGFGWYPSGGFGLLLLLIIVLAVMSDRGTLPRGR